MKRKIGEDVCFLWKMSEDGGEETHHRLEDLLGDGSLGPGGGGEADAVFLVTEEKALET